MDLLVKKAFFTGLTILSYVNPLSTIPFKCVSMASQECKVRLQIVNVNGDEPVFYSFNIKTSTSSGNCNHINDPYAKMCVPDVVKNVIVKVFSLMPRTNETRHRIAWNM